MKRFPLRRRTVLKGAGLGVFGAVAGPSTGGVVATELSSGQELSGAIESSDEEDEYELAVQRGEIIELELEKGSRDLIEFAIDPPSQADVSLGGRGSEGVTTYYDRVTIREAGMLTIEVSTSDAELDSEQSYSIVATRQEETDRWPVRDRQTVQPGEEISGTIRSDDDSDLFEVFVDRGDVIDLEFQKESRDLVEFDIDTPGQGGSDLGGDNSEGETHYYDRYTIRDTGSVEIAVRTDNHNDHTDSNGLVKEQPYSFTVTRHEELDQWPVRDRQTVQPGEEISGIIRSDDDVDRFEVFVDRGDVIDLEFEKESRDLVEFDIDTPGQGGSDLGGDNSEGETRYYDRYTIRDTGSVEIAVRTDNHNDHTDSNGLVEEQPYSFTVTRHEELDQWPERNRQEIQSGEEISGIIRSDDDRDLFEVFVDRGDVIDLEFEKESRDLVEFDIGTPGQGDSDLGGNNSEGETRYYDRYTVRDTGSVEIAVRTDNGNDHTDSDGLVEEQPYSFTVTRHEELDQWPERNRQEIQSGEEISGIIRSDDDRDLFEHPVDEGDIIDIRLEKRSRDLVEFDIDPPQSRNKTFGGSGSEGEQSYEGQFSIESTGTIEIDVSTDNGNDHTDPNEIVRKQPWRFIINGELAPIGEPDLSIRPISITDKGPNEAFSVGVTIEELVGVPTEGLEVTLTIEADDGSTAYEETIAVEPIENSTRSITFGDEDGNAQIGPLEGGNGTYSATVDAVEANASASAETTFSVRDSSSEHPSDVSQETWDAVTGQNEPTDELTYDDLVDAIQSYQNGESVNGTDLTFGDLIELIQWYQG